MHRSSFKIGDVAVGQQTSLFVIAGPCVIEDEEKKGLTLEIAKRLCEIKERTGIGIIFKASYDKANRTKSSSFRGPGLLKGLEILEEVKDVTGLPILTDVHESINNYLHRVDE